MTDVRSSRVRGYTAGVFDLFHVGHLNLLRNAKNLCDELIVGVTSDDLVLYKGRRAIIPFEERAEIVRNVRCVDAVVRQDDMDKVAMWRRLKFGRIFVGDDWLGSPEWTGYEEQFTPLGVEVVYFPYTTTRSSSSIISDLMLPTAGEQIPRPPVAMGPSDDRPTAA